MMNQLSINTLDEGWRQVRAGVALIVWSKLASWDAQKLILVATKEAEFESVSGHQKVQGEFGRLICWITFSVGAEYLAKGACLLNGRKLAKDVKVVRLPSQDIEEWIRLVNANDPSIYECDISFGVLGDVPVDKIVKSGRERNLVAAGFKLLSSAVRNRDAHRYAQNVRAFHFHLVEKLFVPAFNVVLASLDQNELRIRLSEF